MIVPIISSSSFFLFLVSIFTSPVQAKVTVSFSPKTLNRSGDSVLVQWSGVESPSDLDWLGIYSPPESSHDHFIGYRFLSDSPSWKSGSGSISLPLTNLRSNYSFRVFRWTQSEVDPKHKDHDQNPLPGTRHLLAESEQLTFGSAVGRPEQIHLAYTDAVDEMRVMFVAGDGEERYVRYGEAKERLGAVTAARGMRYERDHMCDAPANSSIGWRDPGWVFDIVMKNLKGGIRYYYQVGSDSGGWSDVLSFVARNENSDETVAFMFGDMGCATPYTTFIRTQDESRSTVKWILRDIEALGDKPSLVSHIGDISYARGYSWVWDEFFAQVEPIASKIPYHVCIGNHEYDWPAQPWKPDWAAYIYGKDGGGECGVPYSVKFNMPGKSSESTGMNAPPTRNLYYSYDMGSVHFVYISTETNFLQGSSQYQFIERDLESVNRSKTPFIVLQGHRPMYTTSNEIRDTAIRQKMVEHLEPLLVKNNVTVALWGHVHRYERFCPISNFTCGKQWHGHPVHLVIGMAGQDWQPIWEPRPNHPDLPIFPQPERSMYRGGEFGYTRLVANKEKLTISYVGNHDGEVHDMVEILASGAVISGGEDGKTLNLGTGTETQSESVVSWYIKGAGVMVSGVLLGYLIGFITRGKKESESGSQWIPVKNEET
ncbi:PREDICTED: probable inactive purple acid phosphatase 2 [Tarenaya hassleriana]|uniref:probable inactive purple acid phosphatase 2 n=1 Tax=Tarenaya hassleriana TaxID=28532 RepID=UPI00053C727C|nr:PREDICTED: probable inactive purple acid phosphatase 2 [Tarenaya hassleriana]